MAEWPPSLLRFWGCPMRLVNTEIKRSLAKHFPTPASFILAVSGGRDSQVLLKSFPFIARQMGHTMEAVGVDHGLRPEAGEELDLAEDLAKQVGIPFRRVRVVVSGEGSPQAAARDARYEALRDVAKMVGARRIVTAHHADDRAETVLIRMLRASGAGSLAVLPAVSADIYRPMLKLTRQDITAYAEKWNLRWADEPSNMDEHYTRVWIRNQVLPMMRERFPDIDSKLNLIADDMLRVVSQLKGETVEK